MPRQSGFHCTAGEHKVDAPMLSMLKILFLLFNDSQASFKVFINVTLMHNTITITALKLWFHPNVDKTFQFTCWVAQLQSEFNGKRRENKTLRESPRTTTFQDLKWTMLLFLKQEHTGRQFSSCLQSSTLLKETVFFFFFQALIITNIWCKDSNTFFFIFA